MTARVGRSPSGGARLAWLTAVGAVALLLVATAVDPGVDLGASALYLGVVTSSGFVGALLITRVPGNRVGGLLLATAVLLAAAVGLGTYATLGTTATPAWPGAAVAAVLTDAVYIFPIVIALIGVPLVFPDGHLPSPGFRWIVWLTVPAMGASTCATLFMPGSVGTEGIANPLGIASLTPVLAAFRGFASISAVVGFGGAAAALAVRFRRGTRAEREQTKWLMATAGVATVAFPAAFMVPVEAVANGLFLVGFGALLVMPFAIGIAILRYRLYEIDRIISRGLAWTMLTGLLIAVYAGGVLVLEGALAGVTQGQTLAVAASTLLAAALFQPLRARLQRAMDRQFDRARYDADDVVTAFNERLRDEVDLDTLAAEVRRVAGETVRPASSGIWLRIVPDRRGTAGS
jgi:hypothetical protein